jgi:hypothetical protein
MAVFELVEQNNPHVPQMEAAYFRDYGIHTVHDDHGPIHIASFPDWEGLEGALFAHLPEGGTIITPECSTFTDPHDQLEGNEELIAEREARVLDISNKFDGEIWLGTLGRDRDDRENAEWRNQVLTIRAGEIVAVTNKQIISPYEYVHSPVRSPGRNERRAIVGGRLALICLDLIGADLMKFDRTALQAETTVLASACWAAVPDEQWSDQEWLAQVNKSGSPDIYFRTRLEQAVAMTLRSTFANHVVIADANVPGSPINGPYNAIFRRITEV